MDLNQFRDVDLVIDRANDSFIQRQFVSQGDYKGRTLTVQVTNNGVIGEVLGLSLNLRWQNQGSGLTDLSALTLIDKAHSIYRIEYPQHMMTPGTVVASIQVVQNGKSTFTKQFQLTVQKLAGEPVGIVEKAEFSALVAVLADSNKFRTDIDILSSEKANKTDVNKLATDKADKTALEQTTQRVDGLASGKVDKGGASQVTMGMLSQEVKTAMTGGSVAVVGKDAVSTTNIVDDSVTLEKVNKGIVPVSYVIRQGKVPSLEVKDDGFDILTLSRGDQDLLKWGGKFYWIPTDTKVIPGTSLGGHSATDLLFQTKDNTFRLVPYSSTRVDGEIYITTLSRRESAAGTLGGNGFSYEINNIIDTKVFIPQCIWESKGVSNPYTINYEQQIIVFNESIDFIFADEIISNGVLKNQIIDLSKTVLDTTKTTLWMLLINKLTKNLLFVPYTNAKSYRNGDWWLVTVLRRNKSNFIVIENDLQKNLPLSKGRLKFVNAFGGRFVIDRKKAMLVYRSDRMDFTAISDEGHFSSVFVDGNIINLPSHSQFGTSALLLFFDKFKEEFTFTSFSEDPSAIDQNRFIYFGSIRRILNDEGELVEFSADLPIPWEIDNKLYGLYSASLDVGLNYPSISLNAPIKCIHHRGYSLRYPENTLRAYRESKKIGVNEVEMDISWTKDNIPVNLHDKSINRTARMMDGSEITEELNIRDLTLAEVKQYDFGIWKGVEFKGEKIPTFEECIIQCKILNQRLHIDRAFLLSQEEFEITATILKKHKFNDVVWYIDSSDKCAMIRSEFPNANLAFLIFGDVNQNSIDVCLQFNTDNADCLINCQANLMTETNINLAMNAGVKVYCWNADFVDRAILIGLGVSGIATDFANIQQELLV